MKRKDLPDLLALIIAAGALGGAIAGYGLFAAFAVIPSLLVSFLQVKKVSGGFQLTTFLLVMLLWGATLDVTGNTAPWFILAFASMTCATGMRFTFLGKLGHTRMLWIEPVFLLLSAALYVGAALSSSTGWIGWTAPVVPLLLAAFAALGNVSDAVQMKKLHAKGYSVKLGDKAPLFTLDDQQGNKVSLSDFRGKRHLLLIFVRGDWCPTCHIMLRAYQKDRKKFQEKNIMVMAIGPDPVGVNRDMVERLELDYFILSDEKQEVNSLYGVQVQPNHPGTKYESGIPMPAAFLIDTEGVVRYITRHDQVGNYIDPRDIFPVVESLKQARVAEMV